MLLRPPAVPLINVDPYFSVWSDADRLYDRNTVHWTGRPNSILGIITIDGTSYRFMGSEAACRAPALKQTALDVGALSTCYTFEGAGITLRATFTSPLLLEDLDLTSRPVTYLELSAESRDGSRHEVSVRIMVSEQLCLDHAGQSPVAVEKLELGDIVSMKMGNSVQNVLGHDGDDIRIDWGYVYLSAKGANAGSEVRDGMTYIYSEVPLDAPALFSFAYDDISSIEYFGRQLPAWWCRSGMTITEAIRMAHADYGSVYARCRAFSERMFLDAVRAGGEKYAGLLLMAFRQAVGAHKLVADENGEVLFVSKECYSNGCAATVDVSYPSIPVFLIYNPELVRGMLRPIYRYAASSEWPYDFAPHDAGRYPKVNGQVYGGNRLEKQMPVEECGNMLIMEATAAIASRDVSFALSHMDMLEKWVKYLIDNGYDPANQLCTDDFAGHLAHNCNLSLKAIMGIESMAILCRMSGRAEDAKHYDKIARDMAGSWLERAANGDGSYRLAFDSPGSFSMKYNIVWDKLFGTNIMPPEFYRSEVDSYRAKTLPYGLPLDNRQPYTKSDWLVWTATLAPDRASFEEIIDPLWKMYNYTPSRVPMTDWYWAHTGLHKTYNSRRGVPDSYGSGEIIEKSFRHRSVIGGLFIKLLEYSGKMRL